MKTSIPLGRKCSAILAAGVGATVCLAGGNANAVYGSDGNDIALGQTKSEFGGKVSFYYKSQFLSARGTNRPYIFVATKYSHVLTFGAGVSCATASHWNGSSMDVNLNHGGPNKYIKIKYRDHDLGKYIYGWSQYQRVGNTLKFGAWSYDASGGTTIKTLSDSVVVTKLPLSDGRVKLHWTNANEDGVARYEVQAKDANGEWKAVDSNVPGTGSYATNVPKDSTCRLVVEMVDGQTHEVKF